MNKLKQKILSKKAKVGIIGLGYVGLELAINIAKKKYDVFGFDKNIKKIELIKKNHSPINTIDNKRLKILKKKNLFNLSKIKFIDNCDIIIICLPTPLKNNLSPDNSYLNNCLNTIFPYFKENQILILESTVYPSATKKIFGYKIAKKFKLGKNFFLCFSPERISPGQHSGRHEYLNITKLVSGSTQNCLNLISSFYGKIFKKLHRCRSMEVAEFTKLYENCDWCVIIGFANQMKIIADKLKMNIFEVIEASSTKPFGFTRFDPGPGVGGHCIPVDPLFISHIAKKLNTSSKFISLARQVNIEITKWIIKKIKMNIKKNKKILILGVAYKKNIDDTRESPAISILEKLKKLYPVSYFDPFVKNIKIKNKTVKSLKRIDYKKLNEYEAIILITEHDFFDYDKILTFSKKIFDTRGVYQDKSDNKIIFC